MDVYLYVFCVFIGSGPATGCSPVQGVLPNVFKLRNLSETKCFTDALCFKAKATEKKEREIFKMEALDLSVDLQSFSFTLFDFFSFLILYTIGRT
jgi:hypothetical protein